MKEDIILDKYISDEAEDGELTHISIHGAREHNLKGFNLEIPRDKFVVITGLSGSGKSSLAFDTLYAEGQRRYVECLSPYARQFMGMMKKPDVDSIEGLSPAISIEQKSISTNPRSTVGTVTEIYDYLRLMFAKIGIQYCVDCHVPVLKKSLDRIVEEIIANYTNRRIQLLAPLIRSRKGHYKELFEQLLKQGFTKARIDGEVQDIRPGMQLVRYKIHDIELVVDRCVANEEQEHRITESSELALNMGEGTLLVLFENSPNVWSSSLFSTNYSCPSCGKSYDALSPNKFSFNSPYGACKNCDGIGETSDFNVELMIPDPSLSIEQGGILPLDKKRNNWLWSQINAYCLKKEIDQKAPISSINPEDFHSILYGSDNEPINVEYGFASGSKVKYNQKFFGLIPGLNHLYSNPPTQAFKKSLEEYMVDSVCQSCGGGRLKPENLAVFIEDKNIHDLVSLDITSAFNFFSTLSARLSDREQKIASIILKEISSRLEFLSDVGLSYLSLSRAVRSLSGGESQRIRLASQIGSKLVGIMYVLDEPSIGLHQHDNNKLIHSLKKLRDIGNSVLVVEHDKAMIEQSDLIVDIGPGAGVHGGEIILSSSPDELYNLSPEILKKSLTAQYITNVREIPMPETRREGNGKFVVLKGARGNNLKNVTFTLPLGKMVCITGMSGSGKSSLINDTLYPILSKHFFKSRVKALEYDSITGLEQIDKVIEIDQSPIGRTPRSNPATYTGIFTLIRDLYSMLSESKIRGYKPGRFSFNVIGGRCEECQGAGIKKIEMNFLPDVYVTCDECEGKRYNSETLQVKYKNKSIADVLAMTVEEANDFFSEIPKLKNKLKTLFEVGLGYITLGQQAPTLSGGEAQRVKLATELSKTSTGQTLYLLDEPTTGLHFEDIRILLALLNKLADRGNTIVVIEHNLDVIKCADWIIDLGLEGGAGGGEIIFEGTPEKIIKNRKSYTGKYLKHEFIKK